MASTIAGGIPTIFKKGTIVVHLLSLLINLCWQIPSGCYYVTRLLSMVQIKVTCQWYHSSYDLLSILDVKFDYTFYFLILSLESSAQSSLLFSSSSLSRFRSGCTSPPVSTLHMKHFGFFSTLYRFIKHFWQKI